jgi:hypothetical protein
MAYAIDSKRDSSTTRADCFGAKQKKKRRLSPVGMAVFCCSVENVEIATEDEMKRAGSLLAEIAKIESAVRL